MSAEIKKEIELELAHVLFVDIVGYSKLLISEQRAFLKTLNQIVRGTEQFRKAEAAGRLLKIPAGDGMALVFYTSPEAPVECALEIARADIEHAELELRMGVHTGPVSGVIDVNERANVTGAGINVAQLVMNCGDGGHILLSKRVAEDLEQYAHWRPLLHDLGEWQVKQDVRIHLANLYTEELGNPALPKKLALLKHTGNVTTRDRRQVPRSELLGRLGLTAILLFLAGITFWFLYHRPSAIQPGEKTGASPSAADPLAGIPEKSIAVLPFDNLSSDKENAYFADGIQDEILTRLSKIADLKVISRTSTQHYKSAPENLPEIARQLGVAHILEGSAQKSGNAIRVNVQLIKAADDSHLWADIYDRKLTDIFAVESEVAKAIADQLRAKLTGQEEQVFSVKPTENPEAHDAYLRGLAYALKSGNTPANTLGAQKHLKEAERLDPKFALSWALLSYIDARGYLTQNLQPTAALREEARQAAETALMLQPNLGEAVLAKGYYHYACLKDYDTAMRYFEQARQFLPNSSRISELLAYVTRRQGRWDESESHFNEAERLDPGNVNLLYQHAISYVILRRFPQAVKKLDQVLNITPDDVDTLVQKATVAQAVGDLPAAAAVIASLHPAADKTTALETQVYQAILERQPAKSIPRLKEILATPNPALGYLNSELRFWLGWAQGLAGDHAAAYETWRQTRSELESFLGKQPDNYSLIADLALTCICLRDNDTAAALAKRATAAVLVDKDAVDGPRVVEAFARVAAQAHESDRAIAALEKLLALPYQGLMAGRAPLTPALLRLDPMFDPLRDDPRFQALVTSPTPRPTATR
jgi:TolB-like protein/class 3 adenylate cyclase/Flp pilus assembly protein TadD